MRDGLALFDMHLHLDSYGQPVAVARELDALGVGALAVTTTPRGYERNAELADEPNVRLAAGLHPWWFDDARHDPENLDALLAHVATTRFVGEVGLDFLEKHAPRTTWDLQRDALGRVLKACAKASSPSAPHVVSLHGVRAATGVLDLLEATGCDRRCACVLHWFSGSNEELWRAIRMGCWFSCGPLMMGVKRSKEYVRLIPADRLLLETDYPWSDARQEPRQAAEQIRDGLLSAAGSIAAARGCAADEVLALARQNSAALLA